MYVLNVKINQWVMKTWRPISSNKWAAEMYIRDILAMEFVTQIFFYVYTNKRGDETTWIFILEMRNGTQSFI